MILLKHSSSTFQEANFRKHSQTDPSAIHMKIQWGRGAAQWEDSVIIYQAQATDQHVKSSGWLLKFYIEYRNFSRLLAFPWEQTDKFSWILCVWGGGSDLCPLWLCRLRSNSLLDLSFQPGCQFLSITVSVAQPNLSKHKQIASTAVAHPPTPETNGKTLIWAFCVQELYKYILVCF